MGHKSYRSQHCIRQERKKGASDCSNNILSHLMFYKSPFSVNWSIKANRRKTTGTGRMRHLKVIHRRFKNGFREGTEAKSQKRKGGAAPASSAASQ